MINGFAMNLQIGKMYVVPWLEWGFTSSDEEIKQDHRVVLEAGSFVVLLGIKKLPDGATNKQIRYDLVLLSSDSEIINCVQYAQQLPFWNLAENNL